MSRLLRDGSISRRLTGLLAVIETPEAMGGYGLRAMQEASALAAQRGRLLLG